MLVDCAAGYDAPMAQAECKKCFGSGWLVLDDGGAGRAARCSCRDVRPPLNETLMRYGVPERYLNCTLDSFNTVGDGRSQEEEQLLAAQVGCQQYVDDFLSLSERQGPVFSETGLLFYGAPGCGKTHLAVAVMSALVERYAVRARFQDWTTLIAEIRSSFSRDSDDSAEALLRPVKQAQLLVFDELGAQRPSPWVSEMLYLVINHRYSNRLPTLFTTNFPLTADQVPETGTGQEETLDRRLPAPLLSRLYEMCAPVGLDAVGDYRRQVGSQHLWASAP